MKKFLKVVACFMFVVLATLGFAGCAKSISLKEANKIIDSMSDTSLFAVGVEYTETDGEGNFYSKILYDEEGHVARMYQKDGEKELWTDGTWLYVKTIEEENTTKERALLAAIPSKFADEKEDIEESESYIEMSTKNELKESLEAYSAYAQYGDVTYKKEETDKNLTLTMEIDAKVEGTKLYLQIKYVFKNKKLTEASLYEKYTASGITEKFSMKIKAFNGTIAMPEDANDYTDVSVGE